MGDASSFTRIRIQILKPQAGRKLCQDMHLLERLARFESKASCADSLNLDEFLQWNRSDVVEGGRYF